MKKVDVTYQDKLNELRLDLSHPNNTQTTFILLEGTSDVKLFRKLFNLEKCKVENIPGGNGKVEECVNTLNSIHTLIIGIRDSDFIKLSNINYSLPNMFLTDCHDIEMTMLAQDSVLNSLLFEFTLLPKSKHIQLRNEIMKTIEMVSYLKLLNSIEDLRLKFQKVNFNPLISFTNLEIDFSTYFKRLLNKSVDAKITDEAIVIQKINILKTKEPNCFQLTNGHDLLNTFAKYFREETSQKGVAEDDIARAFRMLFSFEDFKKTTLFKGIEEWGIAHGKDLFPT